MRRFFLVTISLLSIGWLYGQDLSLLKSREWKSSNGKVLKAELMKVKDDSITLKRKSDNRDFTLPLSRLHDDDQTLVHNTRRELEDLVHSNSSRPGSSTLFSGFTNPGEDVWELAHRFGLARKLWERATQSQWFGGIRGAQRVIRLTPQRFERISDVEYFVHGEHVSLKVRLEQLDEKLSLSGDRLMRSYEKYSERAKEPIAQKGSVFLPEITRDNLVSLQVEKVGVVERLVMTISLSR